MIRKHIGNLSQNQARLPFSDRKQVGVLMYASPLERQIIFAVGALFLLCSVLYVYFMISSVMHVAARQELVREVSKLSAEVAVLETKYFDATQSITEKYAYANGYVALKNRSFVKSSGVVTLNTR